MYMCLENKGFGPDCNRTEMPSTEANMELQNIAFFWKNLHFLVLIKSWVKTVIQALPIHFSLNTVIEVVILSMFGDETCTFFGKM